MSEKDIIFVIFICSIAICGIVCVLFSKVSDRHFEKKYFRKKRQPRNVTVSTQNVNNQ